MHRTSETNQVILSKSFENFENVCTNINEQLDEIILELNNDNPDKLDVNQLVSKPLDQLEVWRDQTKNLIDEIYNEKKKEMID